MNKKSLLQVTLLWLLFFVFAFWGFRTPLTGEAQLIGKVFLMLCICYLVVFALTTTFAVTSKKRTFVAAIKQLMVLLVGIVGVVFVINLPFDQIMNLIAKYDREIPNGGCAFIGFGLLWVVMIGHKVVAEKLEVGCKK